MVPTELAEILQGCDPVDFSEVLKPMTIDDFEALLLHQTDDSTPGELVRNPQHPHADKDGMVQMPNVNTSMEMVDLISASRAYEANLSVARNARQMATKALSIGR